jgi:hypothetical protein
MMSQGGELTYHVGDAGVMDHRFKIGDRVQVIGIMAEFYSGKTGTVVGVEPNGAGIRELDRYVIEIPGLVIGDTRFADFQLAPTQQTSC